MFLINEIKLNIKCFFFDIKLVFWIVLWKLVIYFLIYENIIEVYLSELNKSLYKVKDLKKKKGYIKLNCYFFYLNNNFFYGNSGILIDLKIKLVFF